VSQIWENPELGYQEFHAHKVLTDYLEDQGFNVTRSAYGLETAFRAEFSNGEGRTVSFNAEYDSLPGIGHACGHNLIAIAGVSAAIGVKEALEKHELTGRVVLLGTPSEEGGGGKIKMIDAGAYDDVDCSLMAHPGNRWFASYAPTLASWRANVTWEGAASHAAVSPWEGRNALDAFVSAYTMTGLFRQQTPPGDRIHSIVLDGANMVANVIPDFVRGVWGARSPSMSGRSRIVEQLGNIIHGAAAATNTTATIDEYV
jgi:amidohydrolase